jgi:hypothetical protein
MNSATSGQTRSGRAWGPSPTDHVGSPELYADNTSAAYEFITSVFDGGGQINQNVSNGWTAFQGSPKIPTGSDGGITVVLTDSGDSGGYTAADAISFTQVGC